MLLPRIRMVFHCKNNLLKMGVNYNQLCRIMFSIRNLKDQDNVHDSNKLYYSTLSYNTRTILNNKIFLTSSLKCRTYAKGGGKRMKASRSIIRLSDEEMMDVVNIHEYRDDLQEVINKLKQDFVAHLSLRMSGGSVENLLVKFEGNEYRMNELAQISRKNPTLIAINMASFPDGLKPAIQAINDSGLGLNPQQEGTMIYLPIPKVTRELRETLAKNAKTICTTAKDQVRNIQNNYVKQTKKMTEMPEDVVFSATQQLTSIAKDFTNEIEKLLKAKQKDLLGDN